MLIREYRYFLVFVCSSFLLHCRRLHSSFLSRQGIWIHASDVRLEGPEELSILGIDNVEGPLTESSGVPMHAEGTNERCGGGCRVVGIITSPACSDHPSQPWY